MEIALEPLKESINQVTQPIVQLQKEITSVVQHIHLPKFDFDVAWIQEGIKQFKKDIEKFKLILVELGFPPFEYLMPRQIREIVQAYEKEGSKKAERLLLKYITDEFFKEDNLQILFEGWKRNPLINKTRLKILGEIFEAHKRKHYYCSVSTIIPQIEGVIFRNMKHKGWTKQDKIIGYIETISNPNSELSLDEVLEHYFKSVLYTKFIIGKKRASQLSRNAILHGIDIKYGTRTNSIKCILLFDYLVERLKESK